MKNFIKISLRQLVFILFCTYSFVSARAQTKMQHPILVDDIGETTDLAFKERKKTRELVRLLSSHLRESGAKMAIDNKTGEEVKLPDQVIKG